MTKNNNLKSFIPCTFAEVLGEQSSHIMVSVSHQKKDYTRPARYMLHVTPVVVNKFGYSADLCFQDKDYDIYTKICDAPRFNAKTLAELTDKYTQVVSKLVEGKASSTEFKNAISAA